nr:beta-amyrin synthase-like [Quercus suber]
MVELHIYLLGERHGFRYDHVQYLVCLNGLEAIQCPQNFGSFLHSFPCIQPKCGATAEWCTCPCYTYIYGKRFVGPITPLIDQLREELYNEPYKEINWKSVHHLCTQEDIYYPHPLIQNLFWDSLYIFTKPLLTRWPFNKLVREKALQVTMKHIHYEDENSRYITIGCVEKVEDPNGDYFKKHLARIPDYIWVAEDGIKMQSFGSQEWDTGFAIQALLASNLVDEIGPTLARGHDFIKKSQVKDNPSGDFKSMYRHISKGSWTFSDQDHGWQVSNCTAEGLKCCLLFSMIPPEIVGEQMEPEQFYDSVNVLLSLQSKNGGLAAWELAGASDWLEEYVPLEGNRSNLVQTAWAMMGLIHARQTHQLPFLEDVDHIRDFDYGSTYVSFFPHMVQAVHQVIGRWSCTFVRDRLVWKALQISKKYQVGVVCK